MMTPVTAIAAGSAPTRAHVAFVAWSQSPGPAREARPPEDDAREADEQYRRSADAVHRAARLAREQIVVQFDELADEPEGEPHLGFLVRRRCPHVELVTIDEHAARDADEEH